MQCPSCGSLDIEWHEAGGDAVCVKCGTVCEESTIVSAIEFSESAGAATVVGQFVSENCSKPYMGSMHASARSRYGFMRNSRETTLAKGKASIAEVAGRLRLQNHYIDSAHRLFTFAVQRNFVQGRKTMHVVAVCLYIKCREDKSPHMLIDFSDALSVNVFTLGSCFLKFCRLLSIDTPLIDPSLYIHRFAARMDLGSKTQAVAQSSLRIVARMKRDWIQTGRRPAGICAAALLIAARTHGFPRTQAEIVKILRVCGMTVRTRMEEFEATPAAQLTMEQLRRLENEPVHTLDMEQDPPAFARNRVRAPVQPLLQHNAQNTSQAVMALQEASQSSIPARKQRKRAQSTIRRAQDRHVLYGEVQDELQSLPGTRPQATSGDPSASLGTVVAGVEQSDEPSAGRPATADSGGENSDGEGDESDSDVFAELEDDSELRALMLSQEESNKKSAIWTQMNQQYLKDKDLRDQRAADERKASTGPDGKKKRKRQYTKSSAQNPAEEAMENALATKKISKKINYDALQDIFPSQDTAAHSQSRSRRRVAFLSTGSQQKRPRAAAAASASRTSQIVVPPAPDAEEPAASAPAQEEQDQDEFEPEELQEEPPQLNTGEAADKTTSKERAQEERPEGEEGDEEGDYIEEEDDHYQEFEQDDEHYDAEEYY